jgi:hypothetical protein
MIPALGEFKAITAALLLPQVSVLEPSRQALLAASGVQAIVVLGGGMQPDSPEYGQAQPNASTAARLRYGSLRQLGSAC